MFATHVFWQQKRPPKCLVLLPLNDYFFKVCNENSLKSDSRVTHLYIFGAKRGPSKNKVQIPIKTGGPIWVPLVRGPSCQVEHAFLQNNTLSLEWARVAPGWFRVN